MAKRTTVDQLQRFAVLRDYLNNIFYEPDLVALEITLCQYVAHFWFDQPAIWNFVLGPSSSGKTAIILRALSFLPHTHSLDVMSENSFLSGFGKNEGLLDNLPNLGNGSKRKHGIILISDFSTVLNMPIEKRAMIQSQLRTIYDGYLNKKSGNKDMMKWEGKVTIVAACTLSLERYWGFGHDLGERFLMYKMAELSSDQKSVDMSHRALLSMPRAKEHTKRFKDLILDFVQPQESIPFFAPSPDYLKENGLLHTGTLLARLRQNVIREPYGKREISSVESQESPTRLIQALAQVTVARGGLYRRIPPQPGDVALAKRLGITSVPSKRWAIIRTVRNGTFSYSDVAAHTKIPPGSLYKHIEDLEALGLVTITKEGQRHMVSMSPSCRELLESAKIYSRKSGSTC